MQRTDQVPSETSMNVPTAQWLADNGSNPEVSPLRISKWSKIKRERVCGGGGVEVD